MRDVIAKPVNPHELELIMYKWFYGYTDKEIKKKLKLKKKNLMLAR